MLNLTEMRKQCRTGCPADLMASVVDTDKLEQLLDIAEAAAKLNAAAQNTR